MKFSVFHRPTGDSPVTAIGLLMIAVFVLACQDSLVKFISSETSYWQFQTLRSAANLSFTLVLALLTGGVVLLRPNNVAGVTLRALFLTATMFCFFSGAPFLDFAQMAAGLYTYPIFVTLLAAPVLGESVGPWRASAVALGAAGAAVVISPWDSGFSPVQVLPLIAGFFYACNILTLRRACRNESPLALAFVVGIAMFVSGGLGAIVVSAFPITEATRESMPFVAVGWPELSLFLVGFVVFLSVLNLTGNICLSRAYQTADASLLAPFDFIYLLFAAIWGQLLFDHWPNAQSLTGMAMIAGAGVLTAWREQHRQRLKNRTTSAD